jgi:prepilin-type N-terminal cleavage/methylation domain-containing protein
VKADARGFSLAEVLVASAVLLVTLGAAGALLRVSVSDGATPPGTVELSDRVRATSAWIERLLASAGGADATATVPLSDVIAVVVPRRLGLRGADPPHRARTDALTVITAVGGSHGIKLADPLPAGGGVLRIAPISGCPARPRCGLSQDDHVLIATDEGRFDVFRLAAVTADGGSLIGLGAGSGAGYPAGTPVVQVDLGVIALDRAAGELRYYDGYQSDLPLADRITDLQFEYFGDAATPAFPRPALGAANCLYDASGTPTGTALPEPLDGLAPLPLGRLSDGPWCGAGGTAYDADLLRIRAVRVRLGAVGAPSRHGASVTERWFVVAPRGLASGR